MRVEFDSGRQTIEVDGVMISLELLRNLANPNPKVLYSIVRAGDVVTVTRFRPKAERVRDHNDPSTYGVARDGDREQWTGPTWEPEVVRP